MLGKGVCSFFFQCFSLLLFHRHAEVMKKIVETVAEGGGEVGVHSYPIPSADFCVCRCSPCLE